MGSREQRAKVFIAQPPPSGSHPDIFASHTPPFDLESDMLFVGTWAVSAELSRIFPAVPFLSLGSSTPVILWFSRIRSLSYGPPAARRKLDESTGFGYNELNVVALTRNRRFFVPVIWATGDLTQRLGRRYGMPKRPVEMTFEASEAQIDSTAAFGSGRGHARASLLASGRILSRPFDWIAPWWSWPADFPDGSYIRARIGQVPRAQLARVRGVLELGEPWHPRATPLWPLGVYVPGLRMRLPAPA